MTHDTFHKLLTPQSPHKITKRPLLCHPIRNLIIQSGRSISHTQEKEKHVIHKVNKKKKGKKKRGNSGSSFAIRTSHPFSLQFA